MLRRIKLIELMSPAECGSKREPVIAFTPLLFNPASSMRFEGSLAVKSFPAGGAMIRCRFLSSDFVASDEV
jgi:hypothetical protein